MEGHDNKTKAPLGAKKALLEQLKNPFDPSLVKWRVGGGSKQLAYIDARDVMKRLDTVLGADNYQTKYIPIDGGFICELSIKMPNGEWVTRSDGANNTKIEPIKGGISGALKRAANAWGIGRYLYYLDPNKFNSRNVSSWPKWALPDNELENWEDIAEMETSLDTGMDENEAVTEALGTVAKIQQAQTTAELTSILETLSDDDQRRFVDIIANKTDELVNADDTSEA